MNPPGEVLFLRVPPPGFEPEPSVPGGGLLRCVLASRGVSGLMGERRVTCFWVGLGRKVRVPGPALLGGLESGAITDVLDIGCAGALDPTLRRGDLVLSSDDLPFDAGTPMALRRHRPLVDLLEIVARRRGPALRTGPILTHERAVLRRSERLALFERTGCLAVQMEHAWFLQALASRLSGRAFARLRVTHLVMITDAVPRSDSSALTAVSLWHALAGFVFQRTRRGIASVRRDVLTVWPEG